MRNADIVIPIVMQKIQREHEFSILIDPRLQRFSSKQILRWQTRQSFIQRFDVCNNFRSRNAIIQFAIVFKLLARILVWHPFKKAECDHFNRLLWFGV